MRFSTKTGEALILFVSIMSILSVTAVPRVHAPSLGGNTYSLSAVPSYAQEGTEVRLLLSVTISVVSTGSIDYAFMFFVRDPAGVTSQSQQVNHTSPAGETHFSVFVNYTSPEFPGVNSLAGTYYASVYQISPSPPSNPVATTTFVLSSISNPYYQRTETVNVQASGYNASESVNVTIQTRTIPTTVFSQLATASSSGVVSTSWKIPVNATIDNYIAVLGGTTTHKTPPDNQTFTVQIAQMKVSVITSEQASYQRTNIMEFSFQPIYPDGTIASTGGGFLTLSGPNGKKVTLPATYDSISQTFNATYTTSVTNQTGTWTVTLASAGYSDSYSPSNSGPDNAVSTTVQLTLATLFVTVIANTSLNIGQTLRLNVTVAYPDGSKPASATVRAYLVFTGTPAINDTVPLVYDSTLGFWVGTHTASASDTGGLWSLIVTASDMASPANTGAATRAITIQNSGSPTSPSAGFPLFYFEILAAIIAALLVAFLLIFRRKRTGHTSLKIDLEAVHSEAGRIENQEFFQNIKDQLTKDKEGPT